MPTAVKVPTAAAAAAAAWTRRARRRLGTPNMPPETGCPNRRVQSGPELRPAPVDPAAHGADLDVQHLADLLVAETFDVTQHHSGPELRRQCGQGGGHVVI